MEVVRDAWTDERLDDLSQRVDAGFGRIEREFQALRLQMRTEFAAVRSEIGSEFAAVRSEASASNRTMLQVVLGGYAVMIVGFAGTVATIVTQV